MESKPAAAKRHTHLQVEKLGQLDKRTNIDTLQTMNPVLDVRFFCTDAGKEPVREWLKELTPIDRKAIGEDIKTVQFGWPLGMPLVDHLGGDIWEFRVKLNNRIARILFALEGKRWCCYTVS